MKNLRCWSVFAVILLIIMFLTGCAIGVRPRSYDVPPDIEDSEKPGYDAYYDTAVPQTNIHYYYDSGYDPWTMGNYYQYSGPPRAYGGSGSSDSDNAQAESKRPSVKGRDSISASPRNEQTNLKRDMPGVGNQSGTSSVSNESAVNSQKVRKDVRRERTKVSRDNQTTSEPSTKQRRADSGKSRSEKDKEDENKDSQD